MRNFDEQCREREGRHQRDQIDEWFVQYSANYEDEN